MTTVTGCLLAGDAGRRPDGEFDELEDWISESQSRMMDWTADSDPNSMATGFRWMMTRTRTMPV